MAEANVQCVDLQPRKRKRTKSEESSIAPVDPNRGKDYNKCRVGDNGQYHEVVMKYPHPHTDILIDANPDEYEDCKFPTYIGSYVCRLNVEHLLCTTVVICTVHADANGFNR